MQQVHIQLVKRLQVLFQEHCSTVVSYSNNVLKVRNVVAGSGQTNFVQNDIITGTNSGATGSVSTMTEISAVSIGITGNSIGNSGTLIQANSIYSVLKDEMNNYTNIKSTRACINDWCRYSI